MSGPRQIERMLYSRAQASVVSVYLVECRKITYKNSVARLTRSVPRRKNNEAQLSKIITNIHIHYHQIFISDCYLGVILHEFNISAERNCFLKGFCYFFPEFWFSLLTKRYAPGEPCYSIFVCAHLSGWICLPPSPCCTAQWHHSANCPAKVRWHLTHLKIIVHETL